ncbi:hypothetical protein FRC19_010473 [Serendipita sp. 401]|nr:hypothetical protein FRC19_010473 [Serendipita sp. 401]KAG9051752.1 hypothetical protein FS842_011078 [Serendipita sp. 407]
MVREEILRRQLLAAEDRLLSALNDNTLEEFLAEWATLQENVLAAAELDQLSNELLILNDNVCKGVEDIVQSCLNIDAAIEKAFDMQDFLSDFNICAAGTGLSNTEIPPSLSDNAENSRQQRQSAFDPGHHRSKLRSQRHVTLEERFSTLTDYAGTGLTEDTDNDLESDEEDFDEPDPDWDKMKDWFLENIAFPFLDPDQPDPILRSAPISPDHLEYWVSQVCRRCNWQELYAKYASKDRSRMQIICDVIFSPPRGASSHSIRVTSPMREAFQKMRQDAIMACSDILHAKAELTKQMEQLADLLNSLPADYHTTGDWFDEWSEFDLREWENKLRTVELNRSLGTSCPEDTSLKASPTLKRKRDDLVNPSLEVSSIPQPRSSHEENVSDMPRKRKRLDSSQTPDQNGIQHSFINSPLKHSPSALSPTPSTAMSPLSDSGSESGSPLSKSSPDSPPPDHYTGGIPKHLASPSNVAFTGSTVKRNSNDTDLKTSRKNMREHQSCSSQTPKAFNLTPQLPLSTKLDASKHETLLELDRQAQIAPVGSDCTAPLHVARTKPPQQQIIIDRKRRRTDETQTKAHTPINENAVIHHLPRYRHLSRQPDGKLNRVLMLCSRPVSDPPQCYLTPSSDLESLRHQVAPDSFRPSKRRNLTRRDCSTSPIT